MCRITDAASVRSSVDDIEEAEYDHLLKVLIIGDSRVGKSSLLGQYTRKQFETETRVTLGVEFAKKLVRTEDGKTIMVQLWDTAGEERFRAVTHAYYRNVHGALVVFDITQRASFDHALSIWLPELRQHTAHSPTAPVPIMLVGNKSDLERQREVPVSMAAKAAEQHGLAFIETSALQASNVEKAFVDLIVDVYNKHYKSARPFDRCDSLSSGTVRLPRSTS